MNMENNSNTNEHKTTDAECSIPSYMPIRNNNPAQDVIDSYTRRKEEWLSNPRLGKQDINDRISSLDEALKYMVPKELKAGGSMKVKDGAISYEELSQVARAVEAVSKKDADLGGKLPRIFIFPDLPREEPRYTEDKTGLYAKGIKEEFNKNYPVGYSKNYDAIIYNQGLLNNNSKNDILAMTAHEIGHQHSYATHGVKINIPVTSEKIGLLKKDERISDAYAMLAGYDLTPVLQSKGQESSVHGKPEERIKEIKAIQESPGAALKKLEAELEGMKCPNFSPVNSDHGIKTPSPGCTTKNCGIER